MGCGVFGAISFARNHVFPLLYWGIRAQNHRGHQSYGFLTFDGAFHAHKGLYLVPSIKKDDVSAWLKSLRGHAGVANVRYATSGPTDGESLKKNTQPVLAKCGRSSVALSFNGNIVNVSQLVTEFNYPFSSDAELMGLVVSEALEQEGNIFDAARECMRRLEGAFSAVGIADDGSFFAFKDPHGIRPLCAGVDKETSVRAVSSETVGLDINNLEFSFEIEPGEVALATEEGFIRERAAQAQRVALCAFEFAYFARPDSKLGSRYVYEIREDFGRNLARENPDVVSDADVVISMPETGDDAAFGFHEETGMPWDRAVRRHRYIMERAFILLPQERREVIDKKINILSSKIRDRRVAVIDDSIVRGDTTKILVKKLRKMGAKKVHMLITFPRITGPCFYGIDMATYHELIGSTRTPEEIANAIGADSVRYQSVGGFVKATGLSEGQLCFGCVNGDYPTPLARKIAQEARRRVEEGEAEVGRVYEVLRYTA